MANEQEQRGGSVKESKHGEHIAGEANIVINGQILSLGQSMSLRVAVSSFLMTLADPEWRDSLGENLASGYEARLREVQTAIFKNLNRA